VHDRQTGATERVGGDEGVPSPPVISADGRFVAFASVGQEGVAGYKPIPCQGACDQVFLRDLNAGTTTLVSVGLDLQPRAGRLTLHPWPARAGHKLTATMPVTAAGRPLADAQITCAALLGAAGSCRAPPTALTLAPSAVPGRSLSLPAASISQARSSQPPHPGQPTETSTARSARKRAGGEGRRIEHGHGGAPNGRGTHDGRSGDAPDPAGLSRVEGEVTR
jgi:hypothetical protein